MVRELRWRIRAWRQILAIFEYISRENLAAADELIAQIETSIEPALIYPEMFRPGGVAGTRELVAHPNYIVIYRVLPTAIEVAAVIHTRQKYP